MNKRHWVEVRSPKGNPPANLLVKRDREQQSDDQTDANEQAAKIARFFTLVQKRSLSDKSA